MGEDLEEFFLNRKPVKMMIALHLQATDNYVSAISRHVDATYSHTVKTLKRMKESGLVRFEKKGRKKEIFLTGKGEEVAESLRKTLETLEE